MKRWFILSTLLVIVVSASFSQNKSPNEGQRNKLPGQYRWEGYTLDSLKSLPRDSSQSASVKKFRLPQPQDRQPQSFISRMPVFKPSKEDYKLIIVKPDSSVTYSIQNFSSMDK